MLTHLNMTITLTFHYTATEAEASMLCTRALKALLKYLPIIPETRKEGMIFQIEMPQSHVVVPNRSHCKNIILLFVKHHQTSVSVSSFVKQIETNGHTKYFNKMIIVHRNSEKSIVVVINVITE